jgi:hypothetical protein
LKITPSSSICSSWSKPLAWSSKARVLFNFRYNSWV